VTVKARIHGDPRAVTRAAPLWIKRIGNALNSLPKRMIPAVKMTSENAVQTVLEAIIHRQ
jgi:hypothetical protein